MVRKQWVNWGRGLGGGGIWRKKAFSEETEGRSWVRGGIP